MKNNLSLLLVLVGFFSCEHLFLEEDVSNDPEAIFDLYWETFDKNYSYFSYKEIDWYEIYNRYRTEIGPETTDEHLITILARMSNELRDPHVNIFTVTDTYGYDHTVGYPSDRPLSAFQYLEFMYQENDRIWHGKVQGENLAYIRILNFDGVFSTSTDERFKVIDDLLSLYSTTDGLIIDIRDNGGGSDLNAFHVAKRFYDQRRMFRRIRYRQGPSHDDFTQWIDDNLEPEGTYQYTKPVALLTNRRTMSSAEGFVLMMSILPHVTTIGGRSGGASGSPMLTNLPNGWAYRLSTWNVADPEGNIYEEVGIPPDLEVHNPEDETLQSDRIMAAAIDHLR